MSSCTANQAGVFRKEHLRHLNTLESYLAKGTTLTILPSNDQPPSLGCGGRCEKEPFALSMAFQPIVDTGSHTIFAYEALVRGIHGESAAEVLGRVTETNRYAFDQSCRIKAIELAVPLGVVQQGARLSVNFMPGAIYSPKVCSRRMLETAERVGFPLDSLILEITEDERVNDTMHLQGIVSEWQRLGIAMALDDFGAGYAGLNILTELEVNIVKLDIKLMRNLHQRRRALQVAHTMVGLCEALGAQVIGEGIETEEEYCALRSMGVTLMQGFLFARPAFEALPPVHWPKSSPATPAAFRPSAFISG